MNFRPLQLDPLADMACQKAIFVTGCARTGSTLAARLINSLQDVELTNEPSFLYCHFPLIDSMEKSVWKYLYESYLFEDLLMQGLQGRNINLNRRDDGSFWHSKPTAQINDRILVSHRRRETLEIAARQKPGYKLTDMLRYISPFRSLYPQADIVVLVRKPESVIASILSKGWYSNNDLLNVRSLWPFREQGGLAIPYWVPLEDMDEFCRMSELERCVYYYILQHEHLSEGLNLRVLDYDQLLENPGAVFAALAETIGSNYGPMTDALLKAVQEPEKDRSVDMSMIDSRMKSRLKEATDRVRSLTGQ